MIKDNNIPKLESTGWFQEKLKAEAEVFLTQEREVFGLHTAISSEWRHMLFIKVR